MKTTTIFDAWQKANEPDRLKTNTLRQMYVFERYILDHAGELIACLEAGDRARQELDRIKDTIGAQVLLDVVFGDVDPVLAKVVAILAEEPPE